MKNRYNCDVLVLAAGFGKRLGLLTKDIPKPLVEVAGKKLIDRNLEYLSNSGFKKIFINLHYHPDKIRDYIKDGKKWGLDIHYSYEPVILDTGGAVKKIKHKLFGERLLVFNSDIVIDPKFSIEKLFDFHLSRDSNNCATLVVRQDANAEDYGSLGLSGDMNIVKFLNFTIPDKKIDNKVMFTGLSIIENQLLNRLPEIQVFSLTKDLFQKELERGSILSGYLMHDYWCDAGTPERLFEAERYLNSIKN